MKITFKFRFKEFCRKYKLRHRTHHKYLNVAWALEGELRLQQDSMDRQKLTTDTTRLIRFNENFLRLLLQTFSQLILDTGLFDDSLENLNNFDKSKS